MSIVAMNWALRQRLSSPLQQILLYVIADSADPEGVTRYCDPSYMEKHARLTRSTMFRMLGELQGLTLLERRKFYSERGDVRYEIVLNFATLVDLPIRRRSKAADTANSGDDGDDPQDEEMNRIPESHPETMVSADQSPTEAEAKSQSCDYHIDDPSLPKKESPPYPPPGGIPSKMELEAKAKRDALWERFKAGYPSIARMDQALAREELDALSLDDAEWAVSVLPALCKELSHPKAPAPRGAHLWLKKKMFKNFPRGKPDAAPPPEAVWITEGSDHDRALRFVRSLTGALAPFVIVREQGRGYLSTAALGADLLAMLAFVDESPGSWRDVAKGTAEWAAWQRAFRAWTGRERSARLGVDGAIRVPGPFPPSKEGTVYDWPEEDSPSGDDDADQG